MATTTKKINRTALNEMVEKGMSKKEIATELGLLMGELNVLGVKLNINWRTRKRKNLVFEFEDETIDMADPNQPEGEEFVEELTTVNI